MVFFSSSSATSWYGRGGCRPDYISSLTCVYTAYYYESQPGRGDLDCSGQGREDYYY